jgi:hypothetical protein
MKTILTLLLCCVLASYTYGQNVERLDEYTASNGITYKIGDEIKLGRGSDTNGKFVYVNIGGWAVSTNPEQNRLPASSSGLIVTVKKINKYNHKRYKGVYFTVGGGNITNYFLDVENAIQTCEVENCVQTSQGSTTDKFDQLSKLKKLLDDGVLSNEEYEIEKKKILGNN